MAGEAVVRRSWRRLTGPVVAGMVLAFGVCWSQEFSESDMNKAKEMYNKYKSGASEIKKTGSSSESSSVVTGRDPSFKLSGPTKGDEMFAKVHMKIANRNFKNRIFSRAITELDLVFNVIPSHSGGRFMRAVIAARQHDYPTAWRNILIAQESNRDDPKISTFIERLERISPRPSAPVYMPGVYRAVPVHASELAVDAAEKLFNDPVSANLNVLSVGQIREENGKVKGTVGVGGVTAVDEGAVTVSLQEVLPGAISVNSKENDGKFLCFDVELAGVPAKNPAARAVSGLEDFLRGVAEETDVVLKNSREGMPDAEKKMQGTYTIAAHTLLHLNNFLRKISPYALQFSIIRIHLTRAGAKIIWEGDIDVTFLVSTI